MESLSWAIKPSTMVSCAPPWACALNCTNAWLRDLSTLWGFDYTQSAAILLVAWQATPLGAAERWTHVSFRIYYLCLNAPPQLLLFCPCCFCNLRTSIHVIACAGKGLRLKQLLLGISPETALNSADPVFGCSDWETVPQLAYLLFNFDESSSMQP